MTLLVGSLVHTMLPYVCLCCIGRGFLACSRGTGAVRDYHLGSLVGWRVAASQASARPNPAPVVHDAFCSGSRLGAVLTDHPATTDTACLSYLGSMRY